MTSTPPTDLDHAEATFHPGQHMSWDLRDGPTTVLITSVSRSDITYQSADGHRETVSATPYRTLAQQTAGWRPATTDEATAYKARRRPAPQNWN